jgi:hypothetical protein
VDARGERKRPCEFPIIPVLDLEGRAWGSQRTLRRARMGEADAARGVRGEGPGTTRLGKAWGKTVLTRVVDTVGDEAYNRTYL